MAARNSKIFRPPVDRRGRVVSRFLLVVASAGARGELGGLEHDGVAGEQSRHHQVVRRADGVVPRSDN